jgi:8-oxo-dGTP pyrophosphatase MutT (NUDIX family)
MQSRSTRSVHLRAAPAPRMLPDMAHNRRPVLRLGVVDVGVESAELPNGVTVDLAVIRHPGASAIVAIDAAGAIPLLTQYRHAFGGWLKEIPAGCINAGETPRACAERELREEAGVVGARWDQLGTIVTIPSFCDERISLFLARDLTAAERELDHDEVINVDRVPLEEALRMVSRNEIIDAKTIVALHLTREFLQGGR